MWGRRESNPLGLCYETINMTKKNYVVARHSSRSALRRLPLMAAVFRNRAAQKKM